MGRTVAELQEAMTWRELLRWNDFFLDRADEQEAAAKAERRRMRRKGDLPEPPTDLKGMTPEQIATQFGAKIARRQKNDKIQEQRKGLSH